MAEGPRPLSARAREVSVRMAATPSAAPRYHPEDREVEDIERRFSFHAPREGQVERYESIRNDAGLIAMMVLHLAPPGRERSLAITKLEEAVMWANAAIARGEAGEVEP